MAATVVRCQRCGEFVAEGEECPCPGVDAVMVAREDGIDRVERHADQGWLSQVEDVVLTMPAGTEFTVDRIWSTLGTGNVTTHEPRALGAVIRRLVRAEKIQNSGRYVSSRRAECHGRPVPVWIRL